MDLHRKHFKKVDPVLSEVISKIQLEDLDLNTDHFHALTRSIIGQQLSTKAARSIAEKFKKAFRNKYPSAKQILNTSDEKLRSVGLSYSKVKYIKNLAEFSLKNKNFKKLAELADDQIIDLLTQIKGVGRWTVEMFLIFTLGREDVFSNNDLGLRNALKKHYNLRKLPNPKKMDLMTKLWKPYRSYAARYLWRSLDNN